MARPRSTLRIQGPVPVGTSGSSRDWGSHRHRLRSAPGGSPLPALGTSAVKRWAVSQEPRNKEGSVEEMTTKRSQAWSAVGPTAIPPLGQTSSVSGPPLNRVTGSASQSAVVCWSLARMRVRPPHNPVAGLLRRECLAEGTSREPIDCSLRLEEEHVRRLARTGRAPPWARSDPDSKSSSSPNAGRRDGTDGGAMQSRR